MVRCIKTSSNEIIMCLIKIKNFFLHLPVIYLGATPKPKEPLQNPGSTAKPWEHPQPWGQPPLPLWRLLLCMHCAVGCAKTLSFCPTKYLYCSGHFPYLFYFIFPSLLFNIAQFFFLTFLSFSGFCYFYDDYGKTLWNIVSNISQQIFHANTYISYQA